MYVYTIKYMETQFYLYCLLWSSADVREMEIYCKFSFVLFSLLFLFFIFYIPRASSVEAFRLYFACNYIFYKQNYVCVYEMQNCIDCMVVNACLCRNLFLPINFYKSTLFVCVRKS